MPLVGKVWGGPCRDRPVLVGQDLSSGNPRENQGSITWYPRSGESEGGDNAVGEPPAAWRGGGTQR